MKKKIEVFRPDKCDDCLFHYHDSDRGSTCGYSDEPAINVRDISNTTIPWFCAFNENTEI